MRITTSKRLQLISGVMPSEGSIFRRKSWKVRPCGKFCCNCPAVAMTFWLLPDSRNICSNILMA